MRIVRSYDITPSLFQMISFSFSSFFIADNIEAGLQSGVDGNALLSQFKSRLTDEDLRSLVPSLVVAKCLVIQSIGMHRFSSILFFQLKSGIDLRSRPVASFLLLSQRLFDQCGILRPLLLINNVSVLLLH